jgi:hypothetical protein
VTGVHDGLYGGYYAESPYATLPETAADSDSMGPSA